MKIINLDTPREDEETKAPRFTFCAYGPTGVGKTTWAGSFPRPIFLSETSESGYESLRGIGDEALFEPGVKPIIIGIEKMNDMAVARDVLAPFILSGLIQTVVIDSLTFYADLYLTFLSEIHNGPNDNLKVYGALGRHLRDLRVKWHQMGCNVVSLCLAQEPDEQKPEGLPLIPGKEANKYGASCDYLLYLRRERIKQGQQFLDNYEIHSKPHGKFVARARRAVGLPDLPSPLMNSTYAELLAYIGYSADATRAALPPYKDPTPEIMKAIAARSVTVAAPPVAAAIQTAAVKPPVPVQRHVPNAAPKPVATNTPNVSRRPAVPVGRPGNNS